MRFTALQVVVLAGLVGVGGFVAGIRFREAAVGWVLGREAGERGRFDGLGAGGEGRASGGSRGGDLVPFSSEVRAVSRLPGARGAPYPDCYHTVYFRGSAEDPGDEFVGLVLGFEDRKHTGSRFLKTGDRMKLDRVPIEEAPDDVVSAQVADDLELLSHPTYWIRDWQVNRDLGLERGARRLLEERRNLFVFEERSGMFFPPVGEFYGFEHWNRRHDEPAPSVSAILAFARELEQCDVRLVICVVPERRNLYPDLVTRGEYDRELDGDPYPALTEAYGFLRSRGIVLVDPSPGFLETIRAEPAEEHFASPFALHADHHWSPRAARQAAGETAQAVRTALGRSGISRGVGSPGARRPGATAESLIEREVSWDNARPSLRAHESLTELGVVAPSPPVPAWEVIRDPSGGAEDTAEPDWKALADTGRVALIGDSHTEFPASRDRDGAPPAGFHAHLVRLLGEPVRMMRRSGDARNAPRRDFIRERVFEEVEVVVWLVRERDVADPQWTRFSRGQPLN